jgi:hypothetical protein
VAKFIQRNIELGTDARYFSALTQDEQERVDRVLMMLEDETKALVDAEEERREALVVFLGGYVPEEEDLKKLVSIERSLQKLVPKSEWYDKCINADISDVSSISIIHKRVNYTENVSSITDIDTVMNEEHSVHRMIKKDREKLSEIDYKLDKLKNEAEGETARLDPEVLNKLLFQSYHDQAETEYQSKDLE